MPKKHTLQKVYEAPSSGKKARDVAAFPTFSTRINIPENTREKLIALMNAQLACTLDMCTQVKYAHWNVKGPNFYQLHKFFDEVATGLFGFVDELAERATALGGRANGTLRQAAYASSIEEYNFDVRNGLDHVQAIADRLASLANSLRDAITQAAELGDQVTSDTLSEMVRELDRYLYQLEAHTAAA